MENGSSSSGSYSPSSSISFLDSSPNNSESEGEGEGNTYFLPSEIWQNIFNYLSFPDLFKVAQTCQMFRSIIHQKRSMFWRGKFWPINSGSLCPSNRLCHAGTIIDNSSGVFLIILCGDKPRPQSSTRNVGEILNDIWAFNLQTKKWKTLNNIGIPPLTEHGCISFRKELYIFGGITVDNKRTNTLFKYDIETEECILINTKGKLPSPGSCHSCSLYNNKLYVFGGWDPTNISITNADVNQFYEFDLETLTWSEVEQKGNPPSRRRAHRSVLYNDKMYIFGGWTKKPENDLHCFNLITHSWSEIPGKGDIPSPRSRFGMTLYGDQFYVFGGWDGNVFLDDLFSFQIETSVWTKIPNNFPRKIGQQLVCTWEDIMFVFGGNDGLQAHSDFYGLYLTD